MGMGMWEKRLVEYPRYHETISLKNHQELEDSNKRCNIKAFLKLLSLKNKWLQGARQC